MSSKVVTVVLDTADDIMESVHNFVTDLQGQGHNVSQVRVMDDSGESTVDVAPVEEPPVEPTTEEPATEEPPPDEEESGPPTEETPPPTEETNA